MLSIAKSPRKLAYPLLNESAAYPAIPTGPEILFDDASPLTSLKIKLYVSL